MKKLPIGVTDFKKLIEGDYIYVDKTKYIYELVTNAGYIFLNRPRRFGKSLLLSTIEYLFEAEKELFRDLYIYHRWDWNKKYPVIRINFVADVKNIERFYEVVYNQLKLNYKRFNIKYERSLKHPGLLLENLVINVYKRYNKQVVLLVDEYDKPILDLIEDKEQAEEVRKELKSFYSVLKGLDKYLEFVFITGVSKFSKVSLFSGLNQLEDISLIREYANICGYTQNELEYYFKDYLKDLNLEEIKEWYNGYNFLGDNVYNPFDVLLYLKYKVFKNYWYETGKTEFLFKVIKQKEFELPFLDKRYYSYEILEKFDIEYINLEALMFQTGYLTIKEINKIENREMYKLGYPNKEVQEAFNNELLFYITQNYQEYKITQIKSILKNQQIEELKEYIEILISSISYEVLKSEYVYQAAIYGLIYATGYKIIIEDNTSKGRIDLTIVVNEKIVYIIEFKVIESNKEKGRALEQIKQKEYYKKYLNYQKVYVVGIEFNKDTKKIANFEYELVKK